LSSSSSGSGSENNPSPNFEEPIQEQITRIRKPSAYIQWIQEGEGVTDHFPKGGTFSKGIQVPKKPTTFETSLGKTITMMKKFLFGGKPTWMPRDS